MRRECLVMFRENLVDLNRMDMANSPAGRRFMIAALSVAIMVSGCSTYRPLSENVEPALQSGDTIRYTLRDGRQGEMKIEAIDGNTIRGNDGATLDVADATQVERKGFSTGKTAALVGGIGVLGVIVLSFLVVWGFVGMIGAAA